MIGQNTSVALSQCPLNPHKSNHSQPSLKKHRYLWGFSTYIIIQQTWTLPVSLDKFIIKRGSKEHMMNLPHVRHVKSQIQQLAQWVAQPMLCCCVEISREKLDSWRLLLLRFLSVKRKSLQEPWPINNMATDGQLTLGFMSDALRFLFHTGGICNANRGNYTCDLK